MTTEARIEANRRNAQLSTGPRTEAGRAAASRNALRHGLTARHIILYDETAEDFGRFQEALRAALAPGDAVEEQLAERIVLCAWRLRRASRAEAALANAEASRYGEWKGAAAVHPGVVFEYGGAPALAALGRYETALERSLYRAYASLERRQARRAGEAVLAPIVVALDGVAAEAEDRAAAPIENYETKPIALPHLAAAAECPAAEPADAGAAPILGGIDAQHAGRKEM